MSKTEDFAKKFEEANRQFIFAVENCPDEKWTAKAKGEDRSVATVAHHVASSHSYIAERVQQLAAGEQLTPPDIDAMNAEHAAEHPSPSKDEVIALLKENGSRAADIYRSVPEEGLTNAIDIPGRGSFTAQDMIEMVAIGHPAMHLESVRA